MNSTPQPQPHHEPSIQPHPSLAPTELSLTPEQYVIIQHYLPKGYALLEKKIVKRDKNPHKMVDQENMSRFSGAVDNNTEEDQGRSKRVRTKKTDRYLEEDSVKINKRVSNEKYPIDEEMAQCYKVLNNLKKHPNAVPFLEPVDPKKTGASNYFDVIKNPMDLSTVEKNLKSGEYQTPTQFHADINKIWLNSYAYNDKTSKIYKITVEMEKHYKKIAELPKKHIVKEKTVKSVKAKINQQHEGDLGDSTMGVRDFERKDNYNEKENRDDHEIIMEFDQ